jgi:hypothetical protein
MANYKGSTKRVYSLLSTSGCQFVPENPVVDVQLGEIPFMDAHLLFNLHFSYSALNLVPSQIV